VYLPEDLEQVLFVENQDTFLALVDRQFTGLGLVNMGGFRGTALRVREPGQAIFSFIGDSSVQLKKRFDEFWLGHNSLSVYFWGDLDYSGLRILAALNTVFPGAQAWAPGYKPMLDFLNQGYGHIAASAQKDNQVKPGVIGCDFADYVLLPAIEHHQSFVDQELVAISQLELDAPCMDRRVKWAN
jgi:hypothetical protein